MIRQAVPGDEAALRAFLEPRAITSLYLLANLERFGLEPTDHKNATTYFANWHDDHVTGVIGVTQAGYGLVQAPDHASDLASCLAERPLLGVLGLPDHVAAVLGALHLTTVEFIAHDDEPLCAMELRDLPPPDHGLRQPTEADRDLLTMWIADFLLVTRQCPTLDAALAGAISRVDAAINEGDVWLWCPEGVPLGSVGINARAGNLVHVGAVYVPPEHRCKGIAEAMIRALVRQCGQDGAHKAVLFANSPSAERAYVRAGFARIGRFRIALFAQPEKGCL